MVFDEETGFWIIHSVPNFPSIGKYDMILQKMCTTVVTTVRFQDLIAIQPPA